MKTLLNSKYLIFAAGVIIIFQLLIVFSVVYYPCFFNSDTFYLPSIYQDVFYGHGWEGWQLNPAPNFFPDMPAYFIIYFFSGEDYRIASFVFSIIQYFFIFFLLYKLFKKTFDSSDFNRNFVIGSLFSSMFLLVSVINDNFYSAFQLISNSFHLGAFINVLLAFILTINYLEKKKKRTIVWLFLIIVIASFSDKIFIVQYVAVVFFLLIFRFSQEKKTTSFRIVILLVSVIVPLYIFSLFNNSDILNFNSTPSRFTPEFIQNSIEIFLSNVLYVLSVSVTEFAIILISFLSYVLVIILIIKNRKKINYSILAIFLFLSFTLFAPIFSGLYQGGDGIRYIITFYIVALFTFPFLIDLFKINARFNNLLSLLIPVIFLIVTTFQIKKLDGLKQYFDYKDSFTETLMELKAEHNLKYGIANYWYAKKSMMFSENEIRVYSVYQTLNTYTHVTNRRWFYEKKNGEQAVFNFVIIDKDEMIEEVKKTFGEYRIVEKGEVKICITPDFIYPKGEFNPELLPQL